MKYSLCRWVIAARDRDGSSAARATTVRHARRCERKHAGLPDRMARLTGRRSSSMALDPARLTPQKTARRQLDIVACPSAVRSSTAIERIDDDRVCSFDAVDVSPLMPGAWFLRGMDTGERPWRPADSMPGPVRRRWFETSETRL